MMISIRRYINMENFKTYLHMIKPYLVLSCLVFVIAFIVGIIEADAIGDFMNQIFTNMSRSVSLTFGDLFYNNIRVDFIIMITGLAFSVFSVMATFLNGMLLGYSFTHFKIPVLLALTIPHGIFEIPALVLSLTVAFMITQVEINVLRAVFSDGKNINTVYIKSSKIIKVIFVTMVLICVLTAIAAFIEAYVTGYIGINFLKLFNFL